MPLLVGQLRHVECAAHDACGAHEAVLVVEGHRSLAGLGEVGCAQDAVATEGVFERIVGEVERCHRHRLGDGDVGTLGVVGEGHAVATHKLVFQSAHGEVLGVEEVPVAIHGALPLHSGCVALVGDGDEDLAVGHAQGGLLVVDAVDGDVGYVALDVGCVSQLVGACLQTVLATEVGGVDLKHGRIVLWALAPVFLLNDELLGHELVGLLRVVVDVEHHT